MKLVLVMAVMGGFLGCALAECAINVAIRAHRHQVKMEQNFMAGIKLDFLPPED